MKQPDPVLVIDLFPEILAELLVLLSGLAAEDWDEPAIPPSWSVKDVALHLLGGDIGILSRERDGFEPPAEPARSWQDLVRLVNDLNEAWVRAARRLSPRLLCELLEFTGAEVYQYFKSLDPHAPGPIVSWAGPDAAPVWLHLAREYTERWHHQQHIRDALGKPGLRQPRYLAPALDAFVRALPRTYADVQAPEGTLVALTIAGDSGDRWFLRRESGVWTLYTEVSQEPNAEVRLPEDLAWRLFTRGLAAEEVSEQVSIRGDRSLGRKLLDTVSIIA